MRLIDTNLLVYSFAVSMPQHERARDWLDKTIRGIPRVGIPWPSILAFVRLVSNPRVFEHPVTITSAWEQAAAWLECESVWIPQPTDRHAEVLSEVLAQPGLAPNHIPDAHLPALALEHGLMVSTTDSDFRRFEGIAVENPLDVQ
jgi:hypothetical protein